MHPRLCYSLALVAGVLASSGCSSDTTAPARPELAVTAGQLAPPHTLVLGDSYAFGYQPGIPWDDTRRFDVNLATEFLVQLNRAYPGSNAVETNLGCPVEETPTFVHGGCVWTALLGKPLHTAYPGSQLEAARAFLERHSGQVNAVILALGINDAIELYIIACDGNPECVRRGRAAMLDAVSSNMSLILRELTALSAGVPLIVMLEGHLPRVDSMQNVLIDQVAERVRQAAVAAGARIAELAPLTAREECELTFICTEYRDFHPTDKGYRRMGRALWLASGLAPVP